MNMQTSAGAPVDTGHTIRDKQGIAYRVREYHPTDLDDLQRFYEEFNPKRAAQGLPPAEPERIRSWLSSILATGVHMLAFDGDDLIGHGFVVPTSRPGIGEYAVFLREDLRGRGLGTELNRSVMDAGRRAGYKGIWLTVEPTNRAAIRSYEKVGLRFIPRTIFSTEAEMEMEL